MFGTRVKAKTASQPVSPKNMGAQMVIAKARDKKCIKGREIKDARFIPGEHYFVETVQQKDMSGKVHTAPKYVWGIVDPRSTGNRKSPPDIAIFPTNDSFYDIGHLLALELGGSDEQENFIPQFRNENQHGKWKIMESGLRKAARDAWTADELKYLFIQITCEYDPSGGLVPSGMTVLTYQIRHADFPDDPDLVRGWRAAAPHARMHIEQMLYDNKLTDRDLNNTAIPHVHKADASNWKDYMFGLKLNLIAASPLSEALKAQVEQQSLQQFFQTAGKKISASQQRQADAAKAAYRAATERTLVSKDKREALERMDNVHKIETMAEMLKSAEAMTLPAFRDLHGKGGSRPVIRRADSFAAPSVKSDIERLGTIVTEKIAAASTMRGADAMQE